MKRLLTSAAMFLCCMATSFAQFSGSGAGTENDPYLILNPIHLNQLRNFLNQSGVYFKLMADIDLTEFLEDENPDQGWQPVGSSSSAAFKGILDGNGKTVTGLWIKRTTANSVGFFGYTDGATIKNVNIEASTIEGNESVAGVSGYSQSSTISGCSFKGSVKGTSCVGGYVGNSGDNLVLSDNIAYVSVTGTGNSVGGFIGRNDAGSNLTVSGCTLNAGMICGANNVGGCCGENIGNHTSSNSINNTYIHANITGADYVGGLCGFSQLSRHTVNLNNCGFCGEIVGSSNVGGLVGKIYKTGYGINENIQNSFAIGTISATGDYVGGLIGNNTGYNGYGTDLSNNYHSGPVTGSNYVGGLVGYNKYKTITNCYAIGSVAGARYIGGLLGYQESSTTLIKSVAINTRITATLGDVNRVVGYNKGTIGAMGSTDENKSYNRTIVISQGVAQDITDNEMNGTGVSATTLKLKATYVAMGWDFNDTWAIQETECYPYMKSQTAPPVIQSQVVSGATIVSGKCVDGGTITLEIDGVKQQMVSTGHEFSFTVSPLQAGHEVRVSAMAEGKEQSYFTTEVVSFLGKGTEADPYQISTAADLTQVYRKGYYKLMNDIDLTDYINQFSPIEGWQSIGRDGSETVHFDGDGHRITGLWCNSTRDNTGLFSSFANGTIKNLTVVTLNGKQVKGGANTGILIGKMMNGTIENCRVFGTVADGTPVGGLVGLFDGGTITKSQASVSITTTGENSYVGGLVGEITGGEIDQCLTTGEITGQGNESYVGGLVGKNSAAITNCYSTAVISSSYNAAGLVAYNYGLVDKCYAMGDLFSNNYAAGVIGYNDGENAIVRNSAAMNNKIDVVYESQQVQQGGGYGQRIIGGIKNNAPAPEMNNYALKTMQVSVNDVTQKVYDDIMNGVAKTSDELMSTTTYAGIGWDFTAIWMINEGSSYPYFDWEEQNALISSISFDKTSLVLAMGTNEKITATILPVNATHNSLEWSSDNQSVATVENGVVTAIAIGAANITATATDGSGVSATCAVTVIQGSNDKLYAPDLTAHTGKQIVLPVSMQNEGVMSGFQFDLVLPDGVTIATDEDEELMVDGTSRIKNFTISAKRKASGAYGIVVMSISGKTISGNDGEVLNITLDIANGLTAGDYIIQLKDIQLTTGDMATVYVPNATSALTIIDVTLGDVNDDGTINVTDAICVVNHILEQEPPVFIEAAADVNGDNTINVTDAICIVNIILSDESSAAKGLYAKANITSNDHLLLMNDEDGCYHLNLANSGNYTGFQFDLALSGDMTIDEVALNSLRSADHVVSYTKLHNGDYRVVALSFSGATFCGNEGELAFIRTAGNGTATVKDVRFVTTDLQEVAFDVNTTGIEIVDYSQQSNLNSVYDLQGRKMESHQLQQGIYIVNGKKVIVR